MAAPKGNSFWQARSKHGRNPIFNDPAVLWTACEEYFKWVEDNPLKEEKAFCYQGEITTHEVAKMRAMTIGGLCIFLDCTFTTWYEYQKDKDFSIVIARVEQIIREQKFTGAAAELLNPNIIARDLGLVDKKDGVGSITMTNETDEELDNRIKALVGELNAITTKDTD